MVESLEQLFSQALENFEHWLHEEQLREALRHDTLCPMVSNMSARRMHVVYSFSEDLDAVTCS